MAADPNTNAGDEMPAVPPPPTPPSRWADWRDYRTGAGARVVKAEFDSLSDVEYADIRAGMREVSVLGMSAARHVRGDIYEVRADSETGVTIRVLFAELGSRRKVLLSLRVFKKKTRKTPPRDIDQAERRLADWTKRAKPKARTKAHR